MLYTIKRKRLAEAVCLVQIQWFLVWGQLFWSVLSQWVCSNYWWCTYLVILTFQITGQPRCKLSSTPTMSPRDSLLDSVSQTLLTEDLNSTDFSLAAVSLAIKHLKKTKSDGFCLSSDHIICAAPVISEFLALLFTVIVHHGHAYNWETVYLFKFLHPRARRTPHSWTTSVQLH